MLAFLPAVILAIVTPILSVSLATSVNCPKATSSVAQPSTASECRVTSITIPPDAGITPTGVQTFCTCGPSQYDVSTITKGETTYLQCVISGPRLQTISTISSTTHTPSQTISMTELLCATKSPSSKDMVWGSTFKVADADHVVDTVCASMPFEIKPYSGMTWMGAIGKSNHNEDVNIFLYMGTPRDCSLIITADLCRSAFQAILSGNPSCPSNTGLTMGGIGVSDCSTFTVVAGTGSDLSHFSADLTSAKGWDKEHYCDAKLNMKCKL